VVRRHALTDQAWAQIAPLLPPQEAGPAASGPTIAESSTGSYGAGHWGALAGLPERYGPRPGCTAPTPNAVGHLVAAWTSTITDDPHRARRAHTHAVLVNNVGGKRNWPVTTVVR
jgi:transposase